LFNDIKDASKHLDGAIGQKLLRDVSANSGIVPLTYTFSGGFRLMPSTKPIAKLEDFAGLKVGSTKSPVSMDTFKALGADPVEMNVEDVRDSIGSGLIDCGETTYPRFFVLGHDKVAKYINDTTHNVFLTCIITNKALWAKLTKEEQDLFYSVALEAAAIERKETVDQVVPVQERAAALGIPTIKMSEEEKQKCIDATKHLYEKYDSWFSPGLLRGLALAQNKYQDVFKLAA
jgi:TRAP-type C4-dicarboxylate transport system substrate-binding protein